MSQEAPNQPNQVNEPTPGRPEFRSEESGATDQDGTPTNAGASGPSAGAEECDRLARDLEEARAKSETYLDLAQRTQAEFLNYKRRVEQERGEYARSTRAATIAKILPVLDDLDRAISSMPSNLSGVEWVQGVVLIARKIHNTVEAMGVKPVGEVGKPFDPWEEEAIMYEPSTEYPSGTVTKVVQAGYTLDGKVIRPAQVIVSSGPPVQTNQ